MAATTGATMTGETRMSWGNAEAPHYERLRVVVAGSDAETMASIEESLHERGIIEVVLCDSTERLHRALNNEIVDLLLYDYRVGDGKFADVMRRIRRKEIGQNPFVTVIAAIRDSKAETVRRLIEAGVDDLIRMPISIGRVFESIGNAARRRRPFVVTYDYVGPQRPTAKGNRRPTDKGAKVPNTLKSRAFDNVPEEEIRTMIQQAVHEMVGRQLENCGVEIDRLAKRVVDSYASIEGSDRNIAMRGTLSLVAAAASDLRHRARGTPLERVSGLAATLVPIAQRILDAPSGRAAVEVKLLSQLAAAVRVALSDESDSDPTIRAITDTIGNFARRAAPGASTLSAA